MVKQEYYENMKKILIIYGTIFLIAGLAFFIFKVIDSDSQLKPVSGVSEEEIIRKPAVAGQFYPTNPEELKTQISRLLGGAKLLEKNLGEKGEVLGLILPHAGYRFSGQVAARGFKELIDQEIDTIIIIGNSHKERFEGISVFPEGSYQTPLGKIEIDSKLAQAIANENERIFFQKSAHQTEHSIEVELPFLQEVLADFKIVPIIFGNSSDQDYNILAQAIINNIKTKNVLLIASSDLSHYFSYQEAKEMDSKTIDLILNNKIDQIEDACGRDAIKTIMLVMQELGVDQIKLLNYANSGDLEIGDKNRVVGYGAIGFYGERRGNLLNKKEQEELLRLAKDSVELFVKEKKILEFESDNPIFNQNIGAFVTLEKEDQLRGCIGRYTPTDIPLYQVIIQMAVAAASEDKRFYPVKLEELDQLEYEISILSSLEKVDNWQDIETGKHGVQIRSGFSSGVFLPQVATDNFWDLETFLSQLCLQKLVLAKDCYKQEDIEIYTFTAQVFD